MASPLWPATPIHKLPMELVSEIFFMVCNEGKGINVFDCNGQFWILQRVCVPWMNVARNTPLLWNSIRIDDCRFRRKLSVALRRTQLCLELSRKTPLSVTLRISTHEAIDPTIRDIVSALTRHVGRWKYVKLSSASLSIIEGRNDAPDAPQSLIQPGQLKGLQSFILFSDFDSDHCDVLDWNMIRGADALQDVQLDRCYLPGASEFPWSDLKRLLVRGCKTCGTSSPKFDIGVFLRAVPHLEELKWELNTEMFTPMSSVVTFSSLWKLSIEYTRHIAMIMPMLRFPRLTDLEVMYNTEPVYNIVNTSHILSMLKVSGYTIKTLELCMPSDTATLLEILDVTECVEDLELVISPEIEHSSQILSHLVWNPALDSKGSTLLPYLRRLGVGYFDHEMYAAEEFDVYVDGMMDIMDSRHRSADLPLGGDGRGGKWPLGKLRAITSFFDIPDHIYDYCVARMSELEEFGLDRGIRVDVELNEVSYSSSEE